MATPAGRRVVKSQGRVTTSALALYCANNVREDCDSVAWPNYHFSTSLSHSVGRLYKNYDGLLDSFAAFWGLVAATFTGRDKLLGYELMNEPWCGDIFEDPTLLFPGIADRQYLEPMYDVLAAEIRRHDEDTIILFEAVTWEITGIGETIGFTHPPGGAEYSNRSVLSFHNSVQSQVNLGHLSAKIFPIQ